jgi:hypothetical protein
VTSHPNGDFVAAANTPVPLPTRTTVTGGPEGGFINALGKTVTSIPAGIVNGVADVLPPYGFKAEATGANVHDPATSTSVQR